MTMTACHVSGVEGWYVCVPRWEGVSATFEWEYIMAIWEHYSALAEGATLNNAWTLFMTRKQPSSAEL